MKEHPIICRDDEVRAFLEGRKTQMRRPVKPIFSDAFPDTPLFKVDGGIHVPLNDALALTSAFPRHCPFGVAGDRRWVQEAWNMRGIAFGKPASFARYASKNAFHYRATDDGQWRHEWGGWRSASQMPQVVSRITLAITSVRVERLQDIAKEDVKAEGIVDRAAFRVMWNESYGGIDPLTKNQRRMAWEANPFVWVLNVEVRDGR